MPSIDLSILNQRQTPAFFADTLANRPAPSFVGRIFISTDTYDLYRDTGSAWVLLSPSSTGTITGSGAAGQVTYFSAASSITGNNNLFWDSTNFHLGIQTATPDCALDVNHNGTLVAKFNNSTSVNTLIGVYNADSPQWLFGTENVNDSLKFYDATNFPTLTERVTFGINGQTFIGAETTSSGKLVVNQTASDQGIVLLGTTAPSIRVRTAGVGATQQFGLGLSTGVNNFIQGSASGDFCIFNGSSTASPITFGIYDAVALNNQEAARISAARNFIVGKTTDSGQKLQVSGNALIDGVTNSSYIAAINQTNTNAGNSFGLIVRAGTDNTDSAFRVQNAAVTSNLFTIQGSGNVGIGITTPTELLHLSTTLAGSSGVGTSLQITSGGAGGDQAWIGVNKGIGNGLEISVENRDIIFNTGATTSFGGTERLRILSGGNVGIGTTIPNSKLDVKSASQGTGVNASNIAITSSDSLAANIGGSLGYYATSNFGEVCLSKIGGYRENASGSDVSSYLNFETRSGTGAVGEAMRITSTKNVLIGTTTDNGNKLNVNGSIFTNSRLDIENTTNGAPQTRIINNSVNSQGAGWWQTYSRTILATGSGTKLSIPFVNQNNLNIVTVARVTVCSADYNSAFGSTAIFTFSVGSLSALFNLRLLQSGGYYSSITTNGMNVEVTFTAGFGAAYVVIEYLTPVPSYSIDLANITLTS